MILFSRNFSRRTPASKQMLFIPGIYLYRKFQVIFRIFNHFLNHFAAGHGLANRKQAFWKQTPNQRQLSQT